MATPYVHADDVMAADSQRDSHARGQLTFHQAEEEQGSGDEEQLVSDGGSASERGTHQPVSSSAVSVLSPAQLAQSMKKLKYGVDPKLEFTPRYSREDACSASQKMKVDFDEIFVEVEGTTTLASLFDVSRLVYTYTKNYFYLFLTVLLGILVAFVWGLVFSIITFVVVWFINPSVRLFYIFLNIFWSVWDSFVHCAFDPCSESLGLVWTNIKATLTITAKGRPERIIHCQPGLQEI